MYSILEKTKNFESSRNFINVEVQLDLCFNNSLLLPELLP